MLNLTREEVLKNIRFTNKFYRSEDNKIYCYNDEMTINSDKEILRFQNNDYVKVDGNDEYDYFAKLNDFIKNGVGCRVVFIASIIDLCELSNTSYGFL